MFSNTSKEDEDAMPVTDIDYYQLVTCYINMKRSPIFNRHDVLMSSASRIIVNISFNRYDVLMSLSLLLISFNRHDVLMSSSASKKYC